MKTILLIFDETEKLTVPKSLANNSNEVLTQSPTESDEKIELRCNCVRNGAMQKAKRLLKHLRQVVKTPKRDIWILRSSKFKSSEEIIRALEIIFKRYKNEDVTLFFAGHGSRSRWYFGRHNGTEKTLYYYQLEKIIGFLKKRIVVIAECCHALTLNNYLSSFSGKYMLLGLSRAGSTGHASVSVLNPACDSWSRRKIADIRVGEVNIVRDTITYKISTMDIVKGDSSVSNIQSCGYECFGDDVMEIKRFPEGEEPSLKIGSDLDFLFFPPL